MKLRLLFPLMSGTFFLLNALLAGVQRLYFAQRPLHTQLVGFLGDVSLFSIVFLVFPLPLAYLIGCGAQLVFFIDQLLYQKTHLRLQPYHLREIKTASHSAGDFLQAKQYVSIVTIMAVELGGLLLPRIGGVSRWWMASLVGFLFSKQLHAAHPLIRFLVPPKTPRSVVPKIDSFHGPKRFDMRVDDKPHVILLFLESFSARALGAATPHFNRLKERGIYFSNFYANGTLTYRALVAGLFSRHLGATTAGLRPYLGGSFRGIPELFKERGYHTAFYHNGSLAFDRQSEFLESHFDELIDRHQLEDFEPNSWGAPDELLMELTVQRLREQTKPTFATLFTISNHHPWIVPKGYQPPSFGFAANHPLERFLKTTHYTDYALSRLIALLEHHNLHQRTVLVIVGDHGQPMGEHDGNFAPSRFLYEENVHVPCLILGNGRIDNPRQIETLGSHVDLYPTIADLFQQKAVASQGVSLLREVPKTVFFQNPYGEGYWGCREGEWKWIKNRLVDQGELYNLSVDRDERENLASRYPDIASSLSEKTDQFFESVDSPKILEKRAASLQLDLSSQLVSDDELISKLSPHLQEVNLNDSLLLTDTAIRTVFRHCSALTTLTLQAVDITDLAFADVIPPKLSHLDLTHVKGVTDHALRNIHTKAPRLSTLMIECGGVTDAALAVIGPHLTRLHLFNAHHLRAWDLLIENNPHLFRLEIDGCSNLLDDHLHQLKNHPIEHLALIGAAKLTDVAIAALSALPLRSLSLVNCPLVTPEGLIPLASLKLQSLYLKGIPITPELHHRLLESKISFLHE